MNARLAVIAIAALLTAGCKTADATTGSSDPGDPNLTCSFTHPSKSADSLRKLPAPVRVYIKAKVGGIADRGAFFNSGDVVTKPAPFNRYIRGGKLGDGYFLWYEHGGFAYWHQIVLFDRKGAVIAEAHGNGREGLCGQTDTLLDAKR